MKHLDKVSKEKMDEAFPDTMEALTVDPNIVKYCVNCDGLRTHSTKDCPYPDVFRNE